MAFHETRFPTGIAFRSTGGPMRKTDVVTLASGFEERNAVWANSRRRYNAGYGVKSLDDLHTVIAFFEARAGRLYGFRWKDFADWKSCAPSGTPSATDQAIGTGDGADAIWQLVKVYANGAGSWTRTISKPVTGTVKIAVAGAAKTEGVHYTVDTTTGIVTFTGGNIPTAGQAITAGYEFDVPVRFDTDELTLSLEAFTAGAIQDIPIIEVRL
ncbi:MAG: DUF2460 domain-containing protein [Alphaproteobacteria bacterium]|nr:DUF2460 domain-containing protein [Alphaproteobacteria bacterium]